MAWVKSLAQELPCATIMAKRKKKKEKKRKYLCILDTVGKARTLGKPVLYGRRKEEIGNPGSTDRLCHQYTSCFKFILGNLPEPREKY